MGGSVAGSIPSQASSVSLYGKSREVGRKISERQRGDENIVMSSGALLTPPFAAELSPSS